MIDLVQNKIGLSNSGDSLTFSDIESYIRLSGLRLTLPEIQLVKNLSAAFINAFHFYSKEENVNADPPYETDEGRAERRKSQQLEYIAMRQASIAEHNRIAAMKEKTEDVK